MENKKIYNAPLAEIVLFAPAEKITNWSLGTGSGWWKDNSAFWWGKKGPETASLLTGTLNITDEDGTPWKLPGE